MGTSPFDGENAIFIFNPDILYTHASDPYTKLVYSASELFYVHAREIIRDNAEYNRLNSMATIRIKRGEELFDPIHAIYEAP